MKTKFQIGKHTLQNYGRAYVIAEVGSNHDCSLEEALRYVHAAKEAGADAVKFQSFSAEGLFSRKRPIDSDPKKGWEPHPAYPVIERLTVPDEWHFKLKSAADAAGIDFLSAPFDLKKARLLNSMKVAAIKIASGEMTHYALLREVAKYKMPVILSTGMANLNEVRASLEVLNKAGCDEAVLLHCVSLYPPKFEDMNVRAVATLAQEFQIPVGISDHTPGHTVPLLAAALGSCCVEKHVTFNRKNAGGDHPYAMEWPEFALMVKELRNAEKALQGSGEKKSCATEELERTFARKSLYATRDLNVGEALSEENTKLVRFGFGIQAHLSDQAYGKKLNRKVAADEAIFSEDLSG